MTEQMTRTQRIAQLNDGLRTTLSEKHGHVVISYGVQQLPLDKLHLLLAQIKAFHAFEPGDDPYGEHDFGAVTLNDERYFWKIDYYAAGTDFTWGSDDPENPDTTQRVLTIMRATEY